MSKQRIKYVSWNTEEKTYPKEQLQVFMDTGIKIVSFCIVERESWASGAPVFNKGLLLVVYEI